MKNIIFKKAMPILFYFSLLFSTATAEEIPSAVVNAVKKGVFEVVLKKPEENKQITYAQELPFDLIPYQQRNDKYFSIGSAFIVRDGYLITAAHVIPFGQDHLINNLFVRDAEGKVYEIDQVMKYSNLHDFVVFTLKNHKMKSPFKINLNPKLNEKVFAVGNALGEGTVIRDGLLTSLTPEDFKGEWNWLRFSAAASPGNSGGPLLDKNGQVIGVVTMKSETENLNYALPLKVVTKFPPKVGKYFQKSYLRLINTQANEFQEDHYRMALPLSVKKINQLQSNYINKRYERQFQNYLKANQKNLFPNGKGSQDLLFSAIDRYFPHLLVEDKNKKWISGTPENLEKTDIGEQGFVIHGSVQDCFFSFLSLPQNTGLEELLDDSKKFMDLMLKGVEISRFISDQKIRVSSFGAAKEIKIHKDRFDRKWLAQSWSIDFEGSVLIMYSLPRPDGVFSMAYFVPVGTDEFVIKKDIEFYTDFVALDYYGTLKQWKEFKKLENYIPVQIKEISLAVSDKLESIETAHYQYQSDDRFKTNEKSRLVLYFDIVSKMEKSLWENTGFSISEADQDNNVFFVNRRYNPTNQTNTKIKENWENLVFQKYPYNKKALINDGVTQVLGIFSEEQYLSLLPKDVDKVDSVYLVGLNSLSTKQSDEIISTYRNLEHSLKVKL